MKELYLFMFLFTIVNIYIYYYIKNLNTCIDYDIKIYIGLFYIISLIYFLYLYNGLNNKNNFENTPTSTKTFITIDLSTNPIPNKSKLIYWGIDFNLNGIIDIINNKVVLPVDSTHSLKYRIIDINEKLSDIFDFNS